MNVQEAGLPRRGGGRHQPSNSLSTAAPSRSARLRSPPPRRRRPKTSTATRASRRRPSTRCAQQRLLGIQIPQAFGGDGASISDIADMCYTLGRACASTAMIFAMHQTKVACLVRHGAGSRWHETLMRRVAAEQMLLASSTTEGQNGGNIRFSAAAVERAGDRNLAGAQRHRDFLRRAGRRHRHHRAARQRRRRLRPGAAGHHQGRLHAGAQPRLGNARHARHLQRRFRAEVQGFGRADLSRSL